MAASASTRDVPRIGRRRLLASNTNVDQQGIGRKLLRQGNGRALASAQRELAHRRHRLWPLYLQPVWPAEQPAPDRFRRLFAGEFSEDGRWDDDTPVEQRQDVGVFDQDEILKGTRVGEDNHAASCLACHIREFDEALLAQPSAGFPVALENADRVLQGHAAALQEPVEFAA